MFRDVGHSLLAARVTELKAPLLLFKEDLDDVLPGNCSNHPLGCLAICHGLQIAGKYTVHRRV